LKGLSTPHDATHFTTDGTIEVDATVILRVEIGE
jgi:hypothetical protein